MPDYARNDPRGWGGDPRRGAALGRASIQGPRDFAGRLTLRRVRLDSGGYDRLGTYWGHGARLYWYASDEPEIEGFVRAADRDAAKRKVREVYPKASFYR